MMQETREKRTNRTVGKSRQKDFFAVLLFFFLLPYTCSSVVRAGQEKTVETIVPVSGRTVRMQSGSDVRTMTEEAFLIGALAAVIPAEYEPEALKAQAVILRSSCVAGGHLEETVLENGTTGTAQESISQSSVSAVEPQIIDSNSGFRTWTRHSASVCGASRQTCWRSAAGRRCALLRAMFSNGRERLSARLFFA